MKTKLLFTGTAFIASLTVSAQTVEQKIGKAITNPQAKENAAKADVYILEKKIFDSAAVKNNKQSISNKRKKKNGCKKKSGG